MTATLDLPRPAVLAPADEAWTGFELDGEIFALPYHCVEQVMPAKPVTKLPFAPAAVEGVASIWGGVVPVLRLRALLTPDRPSPARLSPDFLVIRISGQRYVLRVDRVLFVASPLPDAAQPAETPLSAAAGLAEWSGLAVTCLASDRLGIADLQPYVPPHGALGPIADYRTVAAPVAVPAAETVLAVSVGGTTYGLRAASVIELLDAVSLTPLPLVPDALLGVAVLRGTPFLTFSLARLLGSDVGERSRRYIVVGIGESRFILAVGSISRLRRSGTTNPQRTATGPAPAMLDLVSLIPPEWLALTRRAAGAVVAPPAATGLRQRFLCVVLGAKSCALPLTAIERVLPPRPPIRLPAGAPAGVHGAIEFGGRVIPLTDGSRWLAQDAGAPVAAHVVLQHGGERRVLAVNGVQRMVTIALDDILPTADPDLRIAGFGRVNGRSVAILSASALLSSGGNG